MHSFMHSLIMKSGSSSLIFWRPLLLLMDKPWMSGLRNHRLKLYFRHIHFSNQRPVLLKATPLILSIIFLAYLLPNSCMPFLSFAGWIFSPSTLLEQQEKYNPKLFRLNSTPSQIAWICQSLGVSFYGVYVKYRLSFLLWDFCNIRTLNIWA